MLGEIHLVHLCSIAFLLVATIGLYWVYLIDKVKLITKKSSLIILIDYMGFQIQRFFKWFVLFSASSSLRWLLTLYSLSQPNCSLHTAEPSPLVFALHSVRSTCDTVHRIFDIQLCIWISLPDFTWDKQLASSCYHQRSEKFEQVSFSSISLTLRQIIIQLWFQVCFTVLPLC